MWPSNARGAHAESPTTWGHGSEDTTVEMELGLPVHGAGGLSDGDSGGERRSQSPLGPESPLKEKVFFTFPGGRP